MRVVFVCGVCVCVLRDGKQRRAGARVESASSWCIAGCAFGEACVLTCAMHCVRVVVEHRGRRWGSWLMACGCVAVEGCVEVVAQEAGVGVASRSRCALCVCVCCGVQGWLGASQENAEVGAHGENLATGSWVVDVLGLAGGKAGQQQITHTYTLRIGQLLGV